MSAGADLPSLLIMGTGILEGYGPYISTQVREDSPLIDVDGLMSDVRSTDDGDEGLRIIFETGAMTKGCVAHGVDSMVVLFCFKVTPT